MDGLVGIDIGSYSIKAVTLGRNGGRVAAAVSAYNPVGQFLPTGDAEYNQLVGALHQLAQSNKLTGKPIATALPESLAFTSIISMPYLSDAELASSIHWEAEQHIPVPLDEVQLEYQVLYKPKKGNVGEKMQVLLVATKKPIMERVVNLFQSAGLELVHLETGLLACYQAMLNSLPTDHGVMLLNLGALSSDVLIIESGKMVLSYTIQTGGLMLTRAIEQGLGLSGQQAEEYKRAYGFDQAQLEGKVKAALDPVMNVLIGEVRKAVQYYTTSHMGAGVRTVILAGGSSYLRGLAPFLTETLSAEVVIANPFQGMMADNGIQLPKDVATYAVAVGLANQIRT